MVNITIEHAVKLFGDTRAVDDVSLRIEQGELFFLLGPSGCGKTTLLRMIAGFYHPDGGRILFDDRDVSILPPHKRNTGMVFQNYALWPHMSVRENLTFGLEMRNLTAEVRHRRVEEVLEVVQMQEYAERSPNQLSGGQQQRVALGRALVLEPDAVLMDEPLSNLDAKLRVEMREQIKRIHERLGLTMVYVTHDQDEALSMADRMAIMHRGRLRQVGTPRGIYTRPESRFVADFIGETNLIPGEIFAVGDQTVIATAVGNLASSIVVEGAKAGDSVLCSIRPEHLDMLTPEEQRTNVLTGEVLSIVYLGDHEQYYVKLEDGTEIKAVEFRPDSSKAERGQISRVGCEPANVVVLRAEEA